MPQKTFNYPVDERPNLRTIINKERGGQKKPEKPYTQKRNFGGNKKPQDDNGQSR